MTICEMEEKMEKEGLLITHIENSTKRYVSGDKVYKNGVWENTVNAYGLYQEKAQPYMQYRFFITDSELGIPKYMAVFDEEDEACRFLLRKIKRLQMLARA